MDDLAWNNKNGDVTNKNGGDDDDDEGGGGGDDDGDGEATLSLGVGMRTAEMVLAHLGLCYRV